MTVKPMTPRSFKGKKRNRIARQSRIAARRRAVRQRR